MDVAGARDFISSEQEPFRRKNKIFEYILETDIDKVFLGSYKTLQNANLSVNLFNNMVFLHCR